MKKFIPSSITIDHEILGQLESISRKQGELTASQRDLLGLSEIEAAAGIDAVHFSTKIEGNMLSRDQVTTALLSKKNARSQSRDLQEVLNYSRARRICCDWVLRHRSLNDEWVLSQHAEILKGIVKGRLRGHYRTAQCVIKDSQNGSIVYMAADYKDVPGLMQGLLAWLRRGFADKQSPLLLAAQFHFELVTIHPFMDGNGRIARLLTNGILLAGDYTVQNYAALEKQHEQDRNAYYQALRSLQADNYYDIPQKQDIHSWVVYWLKCLLATYDEAMARVAGAPAPLETDIPYSQEMRLKKAESLFRRHLKLRAEEYADLVGIARTQAVADLNQMVEQGMLERVGGGRSTSYRYRVKTKL